MLKLKDISPNFTPNFRDEKFIKGLVKRKETAKAVAYFNKNMHKASDYAYWFALGTLWVSYTDYSDIKLWRRLFSSDRKTKHSSLMKPSELEAFIKLPNTIIAYRAKRDGETDWLAYTLSTQVVGGIARERGINTIHQYRIDKKNISALFLRRDEFEIIVTDQTTPVLVKAIALN